MNKKEFVKVNLSTPFPLRGKCKYCKGEPKHYYLARTSSAFKDFETIQFINAWIASNHKRMCQDYYLGSMPKDFTKASNFGHSLDYKGYNPRFHKNHKDHNSHSMSNTIDHLSCDCGKTSWAFNETVAKNRPEVRQRKARNVYTGNSLIKETHSLIFF